LKYTTYAVDGEEPFASSPHVSAVLMNLALSQSAWEKFTLTMGIFRDFLSHCEADCVRLLDNDHLMQQIMMMATSLWCWTRMPYTATTRYRILWESRTRHFL